MGFGEVIVSIVAGLFALAFGAWAHRLDKALDLLERLQETMHVRAVLIERRLTRLESRNDITHYDSDEEKS